MEKEPKIRLAILNELIEEIKTGDYLPYFSDKGEGEFPLAIGREEDLKNYLARIVIDFLECRRIEVEDEIDNN